MGIYRKQYGSLIVGEIERIQESIEKCALTAEGLQSDMILFNMECFFLMAMPDCGYSVTLRAMVVYRLNHTLGSDPKIKIKILDLRESRGSKTRIRITVLYCTVLYCTVLYCTVLYCYPELSFFIFKNAIEGPEHL